MGYKCKQDVCGIHVQVRLQEESKADVCEPIGNLVENHYKQTGYSL